MQHGLNGKLQHGDYLNARACIEIIRYRCDYAVKNIAFAPAILSVPGKIHPEFLRLPWVMADMQTVGARRRGAPCRSGSTSSGQFQTVGQKKKHPLFGSLSDFWTEISRGCLRYYLRHYLRFICGIICDIICDNPPARYPRNSNVKIG